MVPDPSSPPSLTRLTVRFYGVLKDFLRPERKRKFSLCVKGYPSVKDTIEALGVPHPEAGAVFSKGRWVDFSFQVHPGEDLRVYPEVDGAGQWGRDRLRPRLPHRKKFILDAHLGRLVRHLRLLGFDCSYSQEYSDQRIVDISVRQRRIILTRDIGLLKNGRVVHGYWVRSAWPQSQLTEVMQRFHLRTLVNPFVRCLECNGKILSVPKGRIVADLPAQVRRYYRSFYQCRSCGKIYWKGSHYRQLLGVIRRAKRARK